MNLLEQMLKQSYEKMNRTNKNWCGTPSSALLHKRVAKSIHIGKDKYDFLIGPIEDRDEEEKEEETLAEQFRTFGL